MLFHLSQTLKDYWSIFNVVHYISFRIVASLLTTLLVSLFLGDRFIETSKRFFRSTVRPFTPASHKNKNNMPTMGGLFIILTVIINTLLWCNLTDFKVWIFLACLIGFAAIGGIDDWYKIKYQQGIAAKTKFLLQCFISLIVLGLWLQTADASTTVTLPFFKNINPNLGIFFIVWAMFILIGTSNAVNLTDGLDGLAIGSLLPNFFVFCLICYFAGNSNIAHYLHIPFANCAEIAVIGGSLIGASLGFLWYNTYPAQIFMGDVGSLALGSALALMAIMAKEELLLAISGGLFVVEALSVMIQVLSYKFLGRRIFKMAPIHHHFELLGWSEPKITVRFAIISIILCLLCLITLKIR